MKANKEKVKEAIGSAIFTIGCVICGGVGFRPIVVLFVVLCFAIYYYANGLHNVDIGSD